MKQEDDVQVKVEVEDELGIFVKEEESLIGVASTSAYDDDAAIDLADLLVEPRNQFVELKEFQKEALVYTTKVDDMRVWKHLHRYSSKDIINIIITESKPAFPKIYKKKKRRRYLVKFKKLISNLRIYKEKIAIEERSRHLKKHSRHQIIQSSKVEVNNDVIQTINIDDDDGDDDDDSDSSHDVTSYTTTDNEDTDIISTDTVDTNIAPITPTMAVDHQSLREHLTTTRYIVIINTLKSLCDVYYVNNSGIPTEFYRVDEGNLRSIIHSTYLNITDTVNFINCCWFKRDMRIKHMHLENCSSTLYTFMRKPHGCDIGNCTCCCKRKYNHVRQLPASKIIQRSVKSYVKNRWHLRLISARAQQNQNSLINASLVHKPKIKSLKEKEQKRQYFSNLCLQLQCNNKLTHAYYLGKNGLINTFIRSNIFCTLQYFKGMIGSWLSAVPSENICCVTQYKKYCLKLIKRAHPTVVKFLINSSIKEPNKCVTCENLEIQNSAGAKGVMVPLYLPKYPRHTKSCSKVTIRNFNIMEKIKNIQPYLISNTVIGTAIDKSMKSILPNTSQNLLVDNSTKTSITCKIDKNIVPNSINLGIGNIRLGIFPGGKVKILSKSSADEISTENLKILREIIQHAQNKVVSQDFNPTRLVYVNNLFTQDSQKIQEKQSEGKEASTNKLWTVLNSTEKVQSQELNASKNIKSIKVVDNIRNSNLESVITSKVLAKEPELDLIKQDKNVYQVLRNVSSERRTQYLISHELHEKQPEAKEASTNILRTVLSSTEKVQNQELNASKNIQSKKVMDIINSNLQLVLTSKVAAKEPELNLIKQDKNVYQVLRNISAEKRTQYLIAHEFLRNANINLWANVNVSENEKVGDKVIRNISSNTKKNTKRKTAEKGTSPPPKQVRKESLENTISAVPMASTNATFLPTIQPNVSTETVILPQPTFLPTLLNSHLQQIVHTESLQQPPVPKASFSLTENFTVIPIGQLPQELVTNLYKKYAFLPENAQSFNVQAQPVNPINITEHVVPTTSLHDSKSMAFVSLPNSVLMTSDVPRIPIVQNIQAENIENDDAEAQDDNCILGV